MKNALRLAIAASLFCSPVVFADVTAPENGTVRVTVMDEHGAVVPDAPVYIYGEHRTHFVGGADVPGSTTFAMKEGDYRISAALIKRTGDYVDRYASSEAHINVAAGDNVAIVLTLRPVEVPEDQKAEAYGTMHVAGIPMGVSAN
jgi:hypothetical protein